MEKQGKQSGPGELIKVGQTLYRFSSNGEYYYLFKIHGKQFKGKLGTKDREIAKRLLGDRHRELLRQPTVTGNLTLENLIDRYMETIQHLKGKTLEGKVRVANKLKAWTVGQRTAPRKIVRSEIEAWLSKLKAKPANHNHHLEFVRAVFAMAVADVLATKVMLISEEKLPAEERDTLRAIFCSLN